MSKYSKNVKKMQLMQVALIAVCIVALVIWLIIFTRPKLVEYTVPDECGPIGGSISHSIDDSDACMNACSAYCQSLKQEYHDSAFEESTLECHSCVCECKE